MESDSQINQLKGGNESIDWGLVSESTVTQVPYKMTHQIESQLAAGPRTIEALLSILTYEVR